MKEMLPSKPKANKIKAQNSTPVVIAREKLKSVSLEYHKNPSNRLNQKLSRARKDLDTAYLNIEADFIKVKLLLLNTYIIVINITKPGKRLRNYLGKIPMLKRV